MQIVNTGHIYQIYDDGVKTFNQLPAQVYNVSFSKMTGFFLQKFDDIEITEKVYGVATFYAQFSLSPKGENHVAVCLGTACYVKGSGAIYDKFQEILGIGGDECTADRKFSLTASRCIGACGLAPVLTVNEDVYGRLTTADVEGIVAKYK